VGDRTARVARDVLVERATERDVEHLNAPADREERPVLVERPLGERDLQPISRLGHLQDRRMSDFAEPRWVDVAAAREEQPVEARPERVECAVVEARGEEHRHTASLLEGDQVGIVEMGARRGLAGGAVGGRRSGHADQGCTPHGGSVAHRLDVIWAHYVT
jgi:hypothetical protein